MVQHAKKKTADDKKYARQRIKELKPAAQRPKKEPWRESTNHTYELEKDIKRLNVTALSNAQIARVHILPRSYDERVADIHQRGFKPTSNVCKEFPLPSDDLQTKDGRERLDRCTETFNNYVNKRKDEDDFFVANKRQIFADRMQPRWAPASTHGQQFEVFVTDPNNLYKTTLEPLDREPLHAEAFKRTTMAASQFKSEQASII